MNTDSNRQKRLLADLEEEIREAEREAAHHQRAYVNANAKAITLKSARAALTRNADDANGTGKQQLNIIPSQPDLAEGKASKVLDQLKLHPGADFGMIAREVYGAEDADAKHKVRAMINFLSRKGLIHAKARGRWEAKMDG